MKDFGTDDTFRENEMFEGISFDEWQQANLYERLKIGSVLALIGSLFLFLGNEIFNLLPIQLGILFAGQAIFVCIYLLLIFFPIKRGLPVLVVITGWVVPCLIGWTQAFKPEAVSLISLSALWIPTFLFNSFLYPLKPRLQIALNVIMMGGFALLHTLAGFDLGALLLPLSFSNAFLLVMFFFSILIMIWQENSWKRLYQERVQSFDRHQLIQRVYNESLDGIFRMTLSGELLQANPRMATMLGFDDADGLLSAEYNLANELFSNSNDFTNALAILQEKGELLNHIFEAKKPDGTIMWLAQNLRLSTTESGKRYVDGSLHDVTSIENSRRLAEQREIALTQSEARYKAMVDTIPDMMLWYTNEGVYEEVILRDWYQTISNLKPEEAIGKNVDDVLPASTAEAVQQNIRAAIETGETQTYHFGPEQSGRPGQYLEARATASEHGRVLILTRDVSNEFQAREMLKRRDAILNAVGYASTQFLMQESWENKVELVLERLGKAAGVSRSYIFKRYEDEQNGAYLNQIYEWTAEGIEAQIENDDLQNLRIVGEFSQFYHPLQEGRSVSILTNELVDEFQRDHFASQQILSAVFVPIFVNELWWGFMGFDECLIERQWHEAEIEVLNVAAATLGAAIERQLTQETILQGQKLESIGLLAGGIAHDFNNLLTSMIAQSSIALRKLAPDESARKHVERSLVSAEKAAELTQQLLAYAGKGRFQLMTFRLDELLRENIDLLKTGLSRHVDLKLHLEAEHSAIYGDKVQIQQLVMNLIINANEAMSEQGGVLSISTYNYHYDSANAVRHPANVDLDMGLYIVLEVNDSGIGMSEETIGKIFDPYFSTKPMGHGLGLSATMGIVMAHEGGLHVESEVGSGSKFTVYLPAAKKEM